MSLLKGSDTLKQAYPKINSKFDALDAKDRELQSNIDTSNRNNAAEIERIDNRIDNIVSQAGDDNTEIVDARLGADGKARPTLGTLVREIHEEVVEPKYTDPIVIEGGIGSIPDNVVEGQVSVTAKGLTATNIINNGNFLDGTSGWGVHENSATLSVSNNTLIATGTGNSASVMCYRGFDANILQTGHKYYVRAILRVTNSECTMIMIDFRSSTTQAVASQNNPVANQWYTLSGIITALGTHTAPYVRTIANYPDAATAAGKVTEVREVIAIDLTVHGLENKTKEELDKMFPYYWNDTKSTVSAMRLKSVSEDESEVSTAYVVAKDEEGNIAELRSLPNGTKDEINVTDRKLIKRIGEKSNIANGMVIDFADMAEGGTYYAWNEDGETETGIKGDTLGIDATTLIYQLAQEKIIELQPQSLTIYPNGTVYWEPIVKETAVYNNGISIDNGIPIKAIKKLYMTDGQTKTEIPIQNINIAPDGLSFTIVGATDGETYEYIYEYDSSLTTIPTMEIIANKNLKAIVRSTDKALTTLNSAVLDLNDFTVAMLLNHEMRLTLLEV